MLVKPKLNFEAFTDSALKDYLQGIHDALSANVGVFSSPSVSLAAIQTAIDNYAAAILAWGSAGNHGSEQDHQAMVDTRFAAEQIIRSLSGYCVGIANGNKAIVLLGGFSPSADSRVPVGILPAPQNIRSPFSKRTLQGQYRIRWKKVKGSLVYKVYASATNDFSTATVVAWSSKTLAVVDLGLAPGTAQNFWVTAVGTAGESHQSDVCATHSSF